MFTRFLRLGAILGLLLALPARAATLYVDLNSPGPAIPYATWATAATNIQDAVDAATAGDSILVTNGVYQNGGRTVYSFGTLTNRVAITSALTVQSVNGPAATIIQGNQQAGTTNGSSAVRCVYLTNNAALIGFTLTNGATRDDGGSGPAINMNGGGAYCESTTALLSNCVLAGNSARLWGGGISSGTLINCLLISNTAVAMGGGALNSTLTTCILTGNLAKFGGGTYSGTLYNCTLTSNAATFGGGAWGFMLTGCTLSGNSAVLGGGAYSSTLNSCAIYGNSAVSNGGGTFNSTLSNCDVTGNSARYGGGVSSGTVNNCIIFYNTAWAGENYTNATLNYCCTTPLPASGTGNIATEPQLSEALHLSAGSPCRGAGSTLYSSGVDIDGEPWAVVPSIGCDEPYPGAIGGSLSANIQAAYTNVASGYGLNFAGRVIGHASRSVWDFGDGQGATNQPYALHSWAAGGDYQLVFTAFNDTTPGGASATLTVHVLDNLVHHVALNSTNPLPPYLTWSTAATNIQDAVDAGFPGGLILVSNGLYQAGGRLTSGGTTTNRLALSRPVVVQSVNGPAATFIVGSQVPGTTNGTAAVRCAYLTNGAVLIGFTLTNGATGKVSTNNQILTNEDSGGGAWCESAGAVISNCVFTGNAAYFEGGGAYSGTLNNCLLVANIGGFVSFANGGGGACASVLNNCVLVRNVATNFGGGAIYSVLNGGLISNNSAYSGGGGIAYCQAANNCKIISNSIISPAGTGGGAYNSVLNDSLIIGNRAMAGGGGFNSAMNNCTIVSNSATASYGGVDIGLCNNCIVFYNTAPNGPNYYPASTVLSQSCTTPLPDGTGNITNIPIFINLAAGNFRLQSNSPCINTGDNTSAPVGSDLDGRARIVGGTVDMGAYEYQGPGMGEFIAWLQQYGLATDGSADFVDTDSDGMNNYAEWRAGTNPTNAASLLLMGKPAVNGTNLVVTWQSVTNVTYYLQRSLGLQPVAFLPLATNIAGLAGTTSYTDTNAPAPGPWFYRIGVQ